MYVFVTQYCWHRIVLQWKKVAEKKKQKAKERIKEKGKCCRISINYYYLFYYYCYIYREEANAAFIAAITATWSSSKENQSIVYVYVWMISSYIIALNRCECNSAPPLEASSKCILDFTNCILFVWEMQKMQSNRIVRKFILFEMYIFLYWNNAANVGNATLTPPPLNTSPFRISFLLLAGIFPLISKHI